MNTELVAKLRTTTFVAQLAELWDRFAGLGFDFEPEVQLDLKMYESDTLKFTYNLI